MKLYINDELYELPDGVSVSYLLEHLGLSQRKIAVEVNRTIISRSAHPKHTLYEHDRIEIIQAIGGG